MRCIALLGLPGISLPAEAAPLKACRFRNRPADVAPAKIY
jgi:hypothetical protein